MSEALTGSWIQRDGRLVADEVCEEIERLVKTRLVEIGRDASGWLTLFRDPSDGALWERSYPQGHLHGGGPPRLAPVTVSEARQRYGDNVA